MLGPKIYHLIVLLGLGLLLWFVMYYPGYGVTVPMRITSDSDKHEAFPFPKTKIESIPKLNISDKDLYQQRLDVYERGCNFSKKSSISNLHGVTFHEYFYEDKYKLIYCVSPKVATTNWHKLWLVLLGVADRTQVDGFDDRTLYQKLINKYPRLYKLNYTEQSKRLGKYFKFTFVRHPFTRLLSAFRDKFESSDPFTDAYRKKIGASIIKKYRTGAKDMSQSRIGKQVQFKEFVQYVINSTDLALINGHWRPIYVLCSMCDIKYDFIGKFENLVEDSRYILKRVGLQDKVFFPKTNPHVTNSSDVDKLRRYYATISKENILKLYEMYKPDFTLFGYPYPDEYIEWASSHNE